MQVDPRPPGLGGIEDLGVVAGVSGNMRSTGIICSLGTRQHVACVESVDAYSKGSKGLGRKREELLVKVSRTVSDGAGSQRG